MPMYNDMLFDPPAPVARVTLRDSNNGERVHDVLMLLDSGADVTVVPQIIVDELNAAIVQDVSYEVTGFGGGVSFVSAVQLELVFLNKIFRGRFLIVDQMWGVIGRDVLNLVSLLLDGPNLAWGEQRAR